MVKDSFRGTISLSLTFVDQIAAALTQPLALTVSLTPFSFPHRRGDAFLVCLVIVVRFLLPTLVASFTVSTSRDLIRPHTTSYDIIRQHYTTSFNLKVSFQCAKPLNRKQEVFLQQTFLDGEQGAGNDSEI